MSFTACQCFKILDVFRVQRKAGEFTCNPRTWSAISFRLSGESTFQTSSSFYAGPDTLLYLPAQIPFSRSSSDEDLVIVHLKCFEEATTSIQIHAPSNVFTARSQFLALSEAWAQKTEGYTHRCSAILHSILADLQTTPSTPPAASKSHLIQPGVKYIDTSFDDPTLSLPKIAELCSISEEYFRKLYKEQYGASPHKVIVEKRIQKACRLLQSGYFSIEEVAEQSGFQNTKYFSTLFHKSTGMSPRDYKKIYNH